MKEILAVFGVIVFASAVTGSVPALIVQCDQTARAEKYKKEADEHERLYGFRSGEVSVYGAGILLEEELRDSEDSLGSVPGGDGSAY